jgi:5'-3' exonuclease/transcription antitermination factor NusG
VAAHEWVVLELSPQGEEEDPEALYSAIRRLLKVEVDIFVPASISNVGESRVVHKLIDNYVFVRRTLPDNAFMRLEGTRFIASVLTINRSTSGNSTRQVTCVKDADIEKMRRQIHVETEQGIEVGDEVQVMSGPYKGINGRVIEEINETDSVQVFIKLRSKQAIVTLPRSFLRFVSKDKDGSAETQTFSPFINKITRIREWISLVRPIALWSSAPWAAVEAQRSKFHQIDRWVSEGSRLFRETQDPLAKITKSFGVVKEMTSFLDREPGFFELLGIGTGLSRVTAVQALLEKRLLEVQWLQDVVQRLETISADVSYVDKAAVECKPNMVENLIVDGHNLAFRILFALGAMKVPMTDAEGNPTSLIFGVLKSLASLKKRFENATVYVVWDGSPQRRIKLFEGYKSERRAKREREAQAQQEQGITPKPDTQMEQLRKVLPLLGVVQAYNVEEETDDVIAGLVRGKLKGQRNVILSTDRDFLQLVTYTDLLLVPKVGNRPETLYDRDKVVEEYGVTPDRMVQLRALLGDTSDNIPPGAPRVPTKVITSLVNAHGTVDAVLSSNLAGLTPNQYEKIRASEAQARLNVQLMTLLPDLPFETVESKPDVTAASEFLGRLGIQADPILGPFFQKAPSHGFMKGS